jgi:hypothetical protein
MKNLGQQLLFANIYKLLSIFFNTLMVGQPAIKLVQFSFGIY